MRRFLIPILLLFCFTLNRPSARAQGDPVSEVIWRVNALRASYGVSAYQVDPALMAASQAQAAWSAANNHFGHDGPGGSTPLDRALAAGYGGGEAVFAIENVAYGTISLNTPELVVTMWQGDWGHLNAMVSPDYEHIGVGYAEGDEFNWIVMMVGCVGEKASAGDSGALESPVNGIAPFSISTPGIDGAIYHEVQPGQAAWTIAVKYGIPLVDLLALNELTEDSWLHPGDILLIQPPDPPTLTQTVVPSATTIETPTSSATLTRTVVPGDNVAADMPLENPGGPYEKTSMKPLGYLSLGLLLAILGVAVFRLVRNK